MTAICFVDVETTGLDPIRHEIWEIAVIRRETDGTQTEHLWQLRPARWHLAHVAEPEALRIGRYHERAAVPDDARAVDMLTPGGPTPIDDLDLGKQLWQALDGTVMVGSNSAFDAAFLHRLLQMGRTPWHYRTVCVATYAAGYLRGQGQRIPLPYSSHALSRAVGVEPPSPDVAHTALGDAKWAMNVWDAVNFDPPKGSP